MSYMREARDDMNLISTMLSIFKWLFVRLPLGFYVPFTAASLWWVLGGFKRLNDAVADLATAAALDRLQSELPGRIAQVLIADLGAFFHGVIVIALFTLGFLARSEERRVGKGFSAWWA